MNGCQCEGWFGIFYQAMYFIGIFAVGYFIARITKKKEVSE